MRHGSWPIPSCARWARSSAACATTIRRAIGRRLRSRLARRGRRSGQERKPARQDRRVPGRQLHDRRRRRRDGDGRPVSGAGRSDGWFVSKGGAQGRRLRDGGRRDSGVAECRRNDPRGGRRAVRRGPCAVRVDEAERALVGQKPSAEVIQASADAASRRSAPQADLRGSVEYKKHLAGVLVARGLRQAFERLGVRA